MIFSDSLEDYLTYLNKIFNLFAFRNLALSPKKNFIAYPNIKLLGFRINAIGLTTIIKRLEVFRNLIFPEILKVLKIYIRSSKFIRHLIPYYNKISELF